ncbi:hypothetical protein Tco_1354781 [Tanacetum coccineum]
MFILTPPWKYGGDMSPYFKANKKKLNLKRTARISVRPCCFSSPQPFSPPYHALSPHNSESRKSPTVVLFDVDTGRISIRHCKTKEYHSECSGKITRIMSWILSTAFCELNDVQTSVCHGMLS